MQMGGVGERASRLPRDVEEHGGGEDGIRNHEVLPLEGPHGCAEEAHVHDDSVHLPALRVGVEFDVLSGGERLGGVEHHPHEDVPEDFAPGETDGQTGDASDGKERIEVETNRLRGGGE